MREHIGKQHSTTLKKIHYNRVALTDQSCTITDHQQLEIETQWTPESVSPFPVKDISPQSMNTKCLLGHHYHTLCLLGITNCLHRYIECGSDRLDHVSVRLTGNKSVRWLVPSVIIETAIEKHPKLNEIWLFERRNKQTTITLPNGSNVCHKCQESNKNQNV